MTQTAAPTPPRPSAQGLTQIRMIRELLDDGRCVVLLGAPGIGKSTLAGAALHRSSVLSGQCLEVLIERTYRPLSDAVGFGLRGSPDEAASSVVAELDGCVLHIEDVHWADSQTLSVLQLLTSRVPMLLTSRERQPWMDAPAVVTISVAALTRRQAMQLVDRLHPNLDKQRRSNLLAVACGNPLMLKHLLSGDRVGGQLADAIGDILIQLPAEAVDALGMLALHGRALHPSVVGLPPDTRLNTLLRFDSTSVWFAHEQLAKAAIDYIDADRRRRLHLHLARCCGDADAAMHYLAAGESRLAADCALRAASSADVPMEADLLLLAVRAMGTGAPHHVRLRTADALLRMHRPAEARQVIDSVDAPETGVVGWRAEAGLRRAQAIWMAGGAEDALRCLDELIAQADNDPPASVARLLIERAHVLVRSRAGDPEIVTLAKTALDAAHSAGIDPARAQNALGLALSHTGQPGWRALFEAAADAARAADDVDEELASNYWLVSALGFYGPMTDAIDAGGRALQRAMASGRQMWTNHFIAARAVHLAASGPLPDEVLAECQELVRLYPDFRNRAQVDLVIVIALSDRERIVEAASVLAAGRQQARNDEDRALLCCAELELALAAGDLDLAEHGLTTLRNAGNGFFGLNALAESAALQLHLGLPTPIEIPHYSTALTPVLDVVRIEREAFDACAAGHADLAITGFTEAARLWERRGLVRFQLRAALAAVEVSTLTHANPADTELLLRRVVRLSAGNGGLAASRLSRARAATSRNALEQLTTPRQLEVLRLIAAGLSRQAIADALGIKLPTVDSHLRAAMRKLGARTRAHAAAIMSGGPSPHERSRSPTIGASIRQSVASSRQISRHGRRSVDGSSETSPNA